MQSEIISQKHVLLTSAFRWHRAKRDLNTHMNSAETNEYTMYPGKATCSHDPTICTKGFTKPQNKTRFPPNKPEAVFCCFLLLFFFMSEACENHNSV